MRTSLARRLLLVLAVMTLVSGVASAQEEFEYIPETEQAFLGTGCQQDAGGTCSSTQYWLGLQAGEDSVGTTLSATPLAWAFRQLGEEVEYATFAGDDTLAPSYVLRTDAPLTGTISVNGWASGAEIAADSTVRAVIEATRVDNNDWLVLGDVTVNKAAVTPSAATPDSIAYDFEMSLDPELEQVEISELSLRLYVDSVTVLQNGFVDGEGASSIKLPYYRVEPVEPVEPVEG